MASFNGAKFIGEQLDSILAQLGPEDEVIVSDDASTDGTAEIVERYGDPRIRLLRFERDKTGFRVPELVGANFENALKHARGEIVFLSDQDDVWVPEKVERMSAVLRDCTVAVSNAWLMYDEDKRCDRLLYRDRIPLRNYFLRRGKYYGCCMAFRGEMLPYLLPFPRRMPLHDSWIGLVSELMGRACYIPEPLIYHRIHGTNTSENHHFSLRYKISYRLRLLFDIYRRVLRCKLWKRGSTCGGSCPN